MKVKELINKLLDFPMERNVVFLTNEDILENYPCKLNKISGGEGHGDLVYIEIKEDIN